MNFINFNCPIIPFLKRALISLFLAVFIVLKIFVTALAESLSFPEADYSYNKQNEWNSYGYSNNQVLRELGFLFLNHFFFFYLSNRNRKAFKLDSVMIDDSTFQEAHILN
jgi:hypothetical protein